MNSWSRSAPNAFFARTLRITIARLPLICTVASSLLAKSALPGSWSACLMNCMQYAVAVRLVIPSGALAG